MEWTRRLGGALTVGLADAMSADAAGASDRGRLLSAEPMELSATLNAVGPQATASPIGPRPWAATRSS
jgi:hypothetical protein